MNETPRLRVFTLGLALLALAAAPADGAKKPSKKSPHTQIVAVCRVETAPAEKTHKNGRTFLEFDVTIVSYERVKGDAAADPALAIRQDRRIHVVHDLSCGGERLALAKGDAAEIRGEYVAPDNGKDLIHFTHPADGSCGTKGGHPDGGIRKLDAAALKKAA
ncbi:MAG TPA: hypothetical protein PLB01_13050 [Thermoanaerobaculia bacterium]|nr:hypothetical protein [Thermoanaerobaculia bacterium]